MALDDERPIDLIARGEYLPVARVISSIEYPGVPDRWVLDIESSARATTVV